MNANFFFFTPVPSALRYFGMLYTSCVWLSHNILCFCECSAQTFYTLCAHTILYLYICTSVHRRLRVVPTACMYRYLLNICIMLRANNNHDATHTRSSTIVVIVNSEQRVKYNLINSSKAFYWYGRNVCTSNDIRILHNTQ